MITVDEFIKIFLEADECLKKKINVAKLSLDELRSTRKETLKLLDDVKLIKLYFFYKIGTEKWSFK